VPSRALCAIALGTESTEADFGGVVSHSYCYYRRVQGRCWSLLRRIVPTYSESRDPASYSRVTVTRVTFSLVKMSLGTNLAAATLVVTIGLFRILYMDRILPHACACVDVVSTLLVVCE